MDPFGPQSPKPAWDPWPLARLVAVIGAFAHWGHVRYGWSMPPLHSLEQIFAGWVGALCLFSMISINLTGLFLVIAFSPLYATILLNDWFYTASWWTVRTALRLLYMRKASAFVSLACELGLFVGLWRVIELVLRKYGL